MLFEAQKEEIESLKAEVKTVGEVEVKNYIDNFDQMKEFDDFTSYWALWNTHQMLAPLRQVHLKLDVGFLEEFSRPTGGRLDVEAEEKEAPLEEAEDGAIVVVDP